MEPIRVLHCIPWVSSGGVEMRRLSLAEHLPTIEQRVACIFTRGPLAGELEDRGTRVVPVGGSWAPTDLRSTRRLQRLCGEFRPHILHGAVFEGVTQAALLACMHPRTKLIIEEIGIPTGRSPKANLLFRLCAARADRCLGVSNAVGDYLRQMRIPARKRQVLFNGVRDLPATEDRASVRRSLGFANDAVVVGSVGRMYDHVKRFSDLIRAFALVAPTQPKARLLLVGEGPDRAMLTRLAATLGVSERVVFTGYRRDTANLYGAMDVFALTSARESFGLVLVEAMFAALPTICTATGGMVDVVVDKETGLHVPCGAVEQLAAAMTRLLADAGLRERLGEAGALRAASRFSAARYAADVAAVYEDVLRA